MLTPPKGFTYVHLEGGVSTAIKDYRGFSGTSESTYLTEQEDLEIIRECVQNYFFNKESGELIVNLKLNHVFTYLDIDANKKGEKICQSVIRSSAAILNQLAIAIFEIPTKECAEKKLIGLLNGSQNIELTTDSVVHHVWNRKFYDDQQQRRIDFYAIDDFVFNTETNPLNLQDIHKNRFSIHLKGEYQDNPYVLYAIHDVLSKSCGIPLLAESNSKVDQINLQEN
jgi:hypothetical protein